MQTRVSQIMPMSEYQHENPEIREILSKAANDFLGGEINEWVSYDEVRRLLSNVWRAAETYGRTNKLEAVHLEAIEESNDGLKKLLRRAKIEEVVRYASEARERLNEFHARAGESKIPGTPSAEQKFEAYVISLTEAANQAL